MKCSGGCLCAVGLFMSNSRVVCVRGCVILYCGRLGVLGVRG